MIGAASPPSPLLRPDPNARAPRRTAILAAALSLLLLAALAAAPATTALAAAGGPTRSSCSTVTPDGPCGMDLERAWSQYTTGDPHIVIAYVEAGINWQLGDRAKQLVDNVYVNWHETPVPCTGSAGGCVTVFSRSEADYDTDHNGIVNAKDWTGDPRVSDANGNGFIDAEDLVAAFSDGVDQDGDGYTDDISGWDFYDHQNDSATYDAAYDHSDDQMLVLQHECPRCMIMPVKAGDEALDRTDDLAQAWLFAGDAGASVISSVTADLGYSHFMRTAVQYLENHGVAMVEASNDFDSADHQGGMFWPYVLPGNGVVVSSDGQHWVRSDYTSWGTHNVLSAATNGGTTSESTPTVAGVVGLLMAWGRIAAERGLIDRPLNGPEAEQVLIHTAKRVTSSRLAWPGAPGDWNEQYGYGIPDLYRAMHRVTAGHVPPVARIDSPEWYQLFDPTRASSVPVSGTISTRNGAFDWTLEAGLGGQPGKQQWFSIGSGSGNGSFAGTLGTLDLSRIPKSFWSRPFRLSKTKELETVDEYAVTLRLSVVDAAGERAVDRRAINVHHDPAWLPGTPMRLPASGESQPALVDLQGLGHLAAVFGDAAGNVHAIDATTGKELRGWPVQTAAVDVVKGHAGVSPGHDAVIADVAVGDLVHTGDLSVVVSSVGGYVYVFDAFGRLRPGWPKTVDTGVSAPPIPRPVLGYTRLPVQGATAPPVLWDLTGSGKLDVVQAGWDGYLHAWTPDGADVPGWPVKPSIPAELASDPGYTFVNDQKLDSPPAIAYLHGRLQPPDVVERVQYSEITGAGLTPAPYGYVTAYDANGNLVPGWPVKMPGTVEYYGSAQEFVTEGNAAPAAADVSGSGVGPDSIAVGPVLSPPYLIDGTGQIVSTYGAAASWPPTSQQDVPVAFTTSGAFGKVTNVLSYAQAETGSTSLATALLTPNSGNAIQEYEVAYPATGGSERPGFPATRQGIDFLGEPILTSVTSDGSISIVDGGDSNAMHAYTQTGSMADGFPKWTTGWNLYAPVAGDLLSDGTTDLVSVTREGYLFEWSTSGPASANTEWWRAQHDEWNSGNYEAQTRPPGAVGAATWSPGSRSVSFTAPGSTWYAGPAAAVIVTFEPSGRSVRVAGGGPAGRSSAVAVPSGTTSIRLQAVGANGLLGRAVLLR